MQYTLPDYKAAARHIRSQVEKIPETAVILGSGLGGLAAYAQNAVSIPYEEIPSFPVSTVGSHEGRMVIGEVGGTPSLLLSGRIHHYEGYDFEEVVFPVRVLKLLGVKRMIVTNAAGGVNQEFSVGDFMLIRDQINFTACSPLKGPEIPEFGPRFFDMTQAYDREYLALARSVAGDLNLPVQEGIYFYMPGPQFETPAEICAIRTLGGDAVGMSTVAEVMAARQAGIRVLGISFISNLAAGMSGQPLSDEEVVRNAAEKSEAFQQFVIRILTKMERG